MDMLKCGVKRWVKCYMEVLKGIPSFPIK